MDRKLFLKSLSIIPVAAVFMKLNELYKVTETFSPTQRMPVLFLGHGSPMNAIEENEFVKGFRALGKHCQSQKQYFVYQHIGKRMEHLLLQWQNQKPFMILADFPKLCLMYNILHLEVPH